MRGRVLLAVLIVGIAGDAAAVCDDDTTDVLIVASSGDYNPTFEAAVDVVGGDHVTVDSYPADIAGYDVVFDLLELDRWGAATRAAIRDFIYAGGGFYAFAQYNSGAVTDPRNTSVDDLLVDLGTDAALVLDTWIDTVAPVNPDAPDGLAHDPNDLSDVNVYGSRYDPGTVSTLFEVDVDHVYALAFDEDDLGGLGRLVLFGGPGWAIDNINGDLEKDLIAQNIYTYLEKSCLAVGGDADTDTDTDVDTDADTDADTDSDSDADTDGDTDADADSDSDGDTDADSDADTDVGTACQDDRDCGPGELCRDEICLPVACEEDGDCGPGQGCHDGACADVCTYQSDCEDPLLCRDHFCLPRRSSEGGCGCAAASAPEDATWTVVLAFAGLALLRRRGLS